jgi:hypothetical protein
MAVSQPVRHTVLDRGLGKLVPMQLLASAAAGEIARNGAAVQWQSSDH